MDLEAIEMLVRDSMHRVRAVALERLLAAPEPQFTTIPCDCGHLAQYQEKRSQTFVDGCLVGFDGNAPITCVLIATKVSAHATGNWMWSAQNAHLVCAA